MGNRAHTVLEGAGRTVPTGKTACLPRPPYLTDEWLRLQGVEDVDGLLAAMRSEDEVMAPRQLRAIKATRLSFARALMCRMTANRWRIEPVLREIAADGSGLLIYGIEAEGWQFTFAVGSRPVGEEDRLGRFYEKEYDFYGSFFSGPPDILRARAEMENMATKLWSARTDRASLGWTIANRSQRYFAHVVDSLTAGRQPDRAFLAQGGGYIVRNAGWYGNGRQGSRSWLSLEEGHPLGQPYQVDVFILYLWRAAAIDIVEGMAKARNPDAPALDIEIQEALGVGNASGIGMVAGLVRWPAWLSTYNFLRELVLAYAITRTGPLDARKARRIHELVDRSAHYYLEQPSSAVTEVEPPARLAEQLAAMSELTLELALRGTIRGRRPDHPCARLAEEAGKIGSIELVEQMNSIMIEAESDFADVVAGLMPQGMRVPRRIDPRMRIGELQRLLKERYDWALTLDLSSPLSRKYFWYRSEENAENRRGERDVDAGWENETFVDVAGAVQALDSALRDVSPDWTVGRFLIDAPEHCHVVSRVQLAGVLPYSEIRANIIHGDFLPMDGIRFLLSTLGLEASHPHSTRWVRGVFLQGAPLPADLSAGSTRDWLFPILTRSDQE